MKSLSQQEIKDNWRDLQEFNFAYDDYEKNNKLREVLNKMLGTKFKAVFVSTRTENYDYDKVKDTLNLDWSGDYFIIVTAEEKVIQMYNSEWAFIKQFK